MSVDFASIGKWFGLKFSKVVSFGNGTDIRETELLSYLEKDPETRVITMYIEGIENGDVFFNALKSAASRKPVVILKGGLSEAGSRAVASHTASMGGSRVIWESALRQAGAIQVNDLWELAQTSHIRESADFAEIIQQEFNGLLGTKDRGVRQAPFVVLTGATMPAVLVEFGFLSNPDEARRLAEPEHQQLVAEAIAAGIEDFVRR